MKLNSLILLLLFVCLFILPASANAKNVKLSWDANSDATYYVVYYGNSETELTQHTENITDVTVEIDNLDGKLKWFFGVKGFNEFGNSSDLSEVVFCEPTEKLTTPKNCYINCSL